MDNQACCSEPGSDDYCANSVSDVLRTESVGNPKLVSRCSTKNRRKTAADNKIGRRAPRSAAESLYASSSCLSYFCKPLMIANRRILSLRPLWHIYVIFRNTVYSQIILLYRTRGYTGIRAHTGDRENFSPAQKQLTVCFVHSLVFGGYTGTGFLIYRTLNR